MGNEPGGTFTPSEWAAQLRGLRRQLRITQQVLAERVGVSRQAIQQMECGRMCPTERTVKRIASALGYEAELLIKPCVVMEQHEQA